MAIPLFVARLIGAGIVAVLYGVLALPLITGVLIAANRLRYRGWLAGMALVISLGFLDWSGNFAYNLVHWTKSRPSAPDGIFTLGLACASPVFLMGLILKRSSRKRVWIAAMLPLFVLTGLGIEQDYQARLQRDAAEYQKAMTPLLPATGTLFTRCEVKHRVSGGLPVDEVYVQGHVPRGVRVTLLSDPFAGNFQPRYCTGIAGTYRPADSDPAVLGNVTEIGSLLGYDRTTIYTVAVIQRAITRYEQVPVRPSPIHPDLSHPVVRSSFETLGYQRADFNAADAQGSRVAGARGENLFVSALKPLRSPLNAFPCAGPALIVSVQAVERIQAVLPYCAEGWNVFELNEELYFAATTQAPTPPGELNMGPDRTPWLFRVEQSALHQIWPIG